MAASHDTRRPAAPQGLTPRVSPPRQTAPIGHPITDQAFDELLAVVSNVVTADQVEPWRFLLRAVWLSGLSVRDLMKMSWTHGHVNKKKPIVPAWFSDGSSRLTFPQSYGVRAIPLLSEFEDLLLEVPPAERAGRIFLAALQNNLKEPAVVEMMIAKFGKLAGLPSLRSADLRASWARRQVETGLDRDTMGKILGHANPDLTRRYVHAVTSTEPRGCLSRIEATEMPHRIAERSSNEPETLLCVFEKFAASNRKIQSEKTRYHYNAAIRKLSIVLCRPAKLADLSDENMIKLEHFMSGLSPETINHATGRLKTLWRWCCKKGLLTVWPTAERLPVPEPCPRAWEVSEFQQLLAACEKMSGNYGGVPASRFWRAWLYLGWTTGERTGAALKLTWDMLTPRGLDVPGEVRKGGKRAFYRLSDACRAELEAIRLPVREQIFPWEMNESTFFNHFGRLLRAAGFSDDRKSKQQKVRRTHLTLWELGGQDASARAKHSDPSVTARHYLDESMFPVVDPATVLPSLETRKAGGNNE